MSTLQDSDFFFTDQNQNASLSIEEIQQIIKQLATGKTNRVNVCYDKNVATAKTRRAVEEICDTLNFKGDFLTMYQLNL